LKSGNFHFHNFSLQLQLIFRLWTSKLFKREYQNYNVIESIYGSNQQQSQQLMNFIIKNQSVSHQTRPVPVSWLLLLRVAAGIWTLQLDVNSLQYCLTVVQTDV